MNSGFKLLRLRCGLSQTEAAIFLNVAESTIQSWDQSRRTAPPGVLTELRDLYDKIEAAAENALAVLADTAGDTEIEIGLTADDHEARQLGLPCVGAHEALLGLVIAWSDRPVKIVPRGSTAATAGAVQAREADEK